MTLAALLLAALTGCAKPAEPNPQPLEQAVQTEQPAEPETDETAEDADASAEPALPDGVYTADFNTDSSMFHVNEACDGKGTLTVKDGEMTIHVSLVSKTILNLFPGLAEDAQKDGAVLLQPTTDTVTYSDGLSDEVFGFDIPVPTLDTEEFDVALIGKKGTWYDHKVSVSNPEPAGIRQNREDLGLADGTYTAELTFAGGSGKAYIQSPCTLTVADGKAVATVVWSSSKYDTGERHRFAPAAFSYLSGCVRRNGLFLTIWTRSTGFPSAASKPATGTSSAKAAMEAGSMRYAGKYSAPTEGDFGERLRPRD